jgi:hypothetical protein
MMYKKPMCCSLRPAKLTNTVLYAADALHDGRRVHVMGYQNRAENLSKGPNAMLLPIPSSAPMGPDNMLDTTMAENILKDYARAVRPPVSRGAFGGAAPHTLAAVQVFDKGSFSVVLADRASDIPSAIGRIPANKRPELNADIFAAYDWLYPGWKMALCAWDGTLEAEPLLWWYEPLDPTRLFLPALDAHDGKPPSLSADVAVDHSVVVGSVTSPGGAQVLFRDTIPAHLKPFLATKVHGREFNGTSMKNGDFTCSIGSLGAANIHRELPPGA